jgi:NCAIR mutase (PurE)-related protein
MNAPDLLELLARVRSGALDPAAACERLIQYLSQMPFEDIGFARVDHHREIRQGFPEVIYGAGKTPSQVAAIAERILARGHNLLVTRAEPAMNDAVAALAPSAVYHADARAITLKQIEPPAGRGPVLVVAAGTSDVPVAEEAATTAEFLGNAVDRLYDVGVSGIHRLLSEHERLLGAHVLIVVAGMEGALPSVVGGLVRAPVIAVPTSVGYGASFGGLTPLLGMLNSCVAGVAVVNIDNGFGAAAMASRINHLPATGLGTGD